MRDPAEITKPSAVHVVKCRIKAMLDDKRPGKKLGMLQRLPLEMALSNGGVEQIADIIWEEGLCLTVDKNNPTHQVWMKDGTVELE